MGAGLAVALVSAHTLRPNEIFWSECEASPAQSDAALAAERFQRDITWMFAFGHSDSFICAT